MALGELDPWKGQRGPILDQMNAASKFWGHQGGRGRGGWATAGRSGCKAYYSLCYPASPASPSPISAGGSFTLQFDKFIFTEKPGLFWGNSCPQLILGVLSWVKAAVSAQLCSTWSPLSVGWFCSVCRPHSSSMAELLASKAEQGPMPSTSLSLSFSQFLSLSLTSFSPSLTQFLAPLTSQHSHTRTILEWIV